MVSESRFRIASVDFAAHAAGVPPYAGVAQWVTASLRQKGQAGGLFQVDGAYFEGLTRLPTGGSLLAAERQPRGLMELGGDHAAASARVWAMPASAYPLPWGRNSDFTDLTLADGQVFVLVRNAHLVVNLRFDGVWREARAFSYAAAENDARFAYVDRVYGLGEGLAITEHEIFVVLDNNGQARVADAADRRPILFVFDRPRDL